VRRTSVAALALGIVLLLDVMRAWLPSVIFVYGRAGSTPATQMGLFAVLPFLLALVAVLAVRQLGARTVSRLAAVIAVAGRLALQATDGGDAQLWLSTIAVAALLWWLVATAGAVDERVAALGVVLGLSADAIVHTALRSIGVVWRGGAAAWLALLLLVGAFLLAEHRGSSVRSPRGPALGWMAVGSALVVHGIVAAPVSRVHAITGWSEWVAAAVIVTGHLAAVGVAAFIASGRLRGMGGWRVGVAGGLGVPAALGLALLGGPAAAAIGHLLLPPALAAAVAAGLSAGRSAPTRRSLASAGGLLLFIVLSFGYYAAYDIALPFRNDALVVAAALIAVTFSFFAVRGAGAHGTVDGGVGPAVPVPAFAGMLAVTLLLTVGWVGFASAPPVPQPGEGFPLRAFNYNLQMGFDIDGVHAVGRQAELLAEQRPDVVALQEVSRGWLLNASTDVLPTISERLGMPYVFAPAADRVWGNAIVSRYPVIESAYELLPRSGSAMQRSVLWAVIDVSGTPVTFVATHLQHVEGQTDVRRAQAEVVARVVRDHVEAGRPVVLLGDMNAEPGAAELAPYEPLLEEVTGLEGPIATWPSWDPQGHIDHIYLTHDLAASEVVVPSSTASDHLGVGVTIRPVRGAP
jgi:endonuclease/exonuclease/phosphatase family metal-dependent hydrolase